MDMKLTDCELSALRALDHENFIGSTEHQKGEVPRRLFALNLVAHDPLGAILLTKYGKRTLFRYTCIHMLASLGRGETPSLTAGVEKWLRASGFIDNGQPYRSLFITSHGRLWLAYFEQKCDVAAQVLTAADFERRRAL